MAEEGKDSTDTKPNLAEGFQAVLFERFKSPLISAFIISWCVTNYQVLLIVFGNAKLAFKLEKLNAYFAGPITINVPAYWWIYGAPLIATVLYIVVFPFFNHIATKISNWHDNRLKNLNFESRYRNQIEVLNSKLESVSTTAKNQEKQIQFMLMESKRREEFYLEAMHQRFMGDSIPEPILAIHAQFILIHLIPTINTNGTVPKRFIVREAEKHEFCNPTVLEEAYYTLVNEGFIESVKVENVSDSEAARINVLKIPDLIERGFISEDMASAFGDEISLVAR